MRTRGAEFWFEATWSCSAVPLLIILRPPAEEGLPFWQAAMSTLSIPPLTVTGRPTLRSGRMLAAAALIMQGSYSLNAARFLETRLQPVIFRLLAAAAL